MLMHSNVLAQQSSNSFTLSDLMQLHAALGNEHQNVHPCGLSEQCLALVRFPSVVSLQHMRALCHATLTCEED